jgi:hypothetical protein
MPKLLHNHKDFNALISIVANNMSIAPALVEKDYWIMHCLYGLQKMYLTFELKGGTLSTFSNRSSSDNGSNGRNRAESVRTICG